MVAYVDDDVGTTSAHLLIGQNLRWANFWPNFSHFRSSFSAILATQFQHFGSPVSAILAAQFGHRFLAHFLAHYYSTYDPYTQPIFTHTAHIHSL